MTWTPFPSPPQLQSEAHQSLREALAANAFKNKFKELKAKCLFVIAVDGANSFHIQKSNRIKKILAHKFDLDHAVIDLADSGIADYEKYAPTIFYQMFILKTGEAEEIRSSLKKVLYNPSKKNPKKDRFKIERHGLLIHLW